MFQSSGYVRVGPRCCIMGLYPRNVSREIPVGENSAVALTFGNQFCKVNGNYSATEFRTLSWIHPPKGWWRDLTTYILVHFEEDLERLNLHEAVRATSYGIEMNVACFYAIFELYYLALGTFFTPVGELGMAFMRCGKSLLCLLGLSHTKNTFRARRNWLFWRSRSLPCSRPTGS